MGRLIPSNLAAFDRFAPAWVNASWMTSRSARARAARISSDLPSSSPAGEVEVRSGDQRPLGHHHGALYPVLELAHIAGPRIIADRGERGTGKAARGATVFRGEAPQKKAGKHDRVRRPLAQRRNPHRHLVQPIVQVFAKASLGHHPVEVLIGGADDAYIDLNRAAPADPLDDLVLQKAQQLDLHRQRHVADLVEKQRALMGAFDPCRCSAEAHR